MDPTAGEEHALLHDVDFHAQSEQLVCLIGEVGSGKTSFLLSIAGETSITEGSREVHGRVAYVEQEPFILSDTVRSNILFGKPFDEERMHSVLEASQMTSDIANLP